MYLLKYVLPALYKRGHQDGNGFFLLNFVSKVDILVLLAGDSMEHRRTSISHQYVPTGSICAE